MMAWFTTTANNDLDNTLERAAHQALIKFCERHLPGLAGTAIALFQVQNEGNTVWSERLAAVGDPRAFGIPRGVGVHGTLCPAHELHVPGERGD
jgi:hypothetical protein